MIISVQKISQANRQDFSKLHCEKNGEGWCHCVAWCQCCPRDRLKKLISQYSLEPSPETWVEDVTMSSDYNNGTFKTVYSHVTIQGFQFERVFNKDAAKKHFGYETERIIEGIP
jgi:hypothetical protein